MVFTYFKNKVVLLLLLISFLPVPAFAARVYLESSKNIVSVGDTVVVDIKADSEDELINVVEGNINLGDFANLGQVKDIIVAGSVPIVWSVSPSLSSDKKNISFAAGVAGGFNLPNATLFKIVFLVDKIGTLKLSPDNLNVYLNDGKGTLAITTSESLEIIVNEKDKDLPTNQWESTVKSDTTSPEPFVVSFGRDESVFDGKKFIAFNATDNESGIDYYEVVEGNLPAMRSGNTYVLQSQDSSGKIIVTAYDKAGNKRVEVFKNPSELPLNIILISLLIGILVYVVRRFTKPKLEK